MSVTPIYSEREIDSEDQKPPDTVIAQIMCHAVCHGPTWHDFVKRICVWWGERILHKKLIFKCRRCQTDRVYGIEQ